MVYNLFYSWQSDLDSKVTRYLIQDALKASIKKIEKENKVSIYLDQATRDEKGAVHIAKSTENKIQQCDIFLCDASIINNRSKNRKTLNPNVMYELGVASETVKWENIVIVINEHYGKCENLPFDIKFRRNIKYSLSPSSGAAKKKHVKTDLRDQIYHALKTFEFGKPKLRLKEIVAHLGDSNWLAYNFIDGQIKTEEKKGEVHITHIFRNIFSLSFSSYEYGKRFPEGDWEARFFINQETLTTAELFFRSEVDFGFKRIALPLDRIYKEIFLHGEHPYGKQVLLKDE